jgi:ATP-dependent exoDNAse (exonuclease V) alpha subunit
MTINKVQGQTIPNVGVYLPELVFSHGQLYVALSRATARSNIKILAIPPSDKKDKRKKKTVNPTYTKNMSIERSSFDDKVLSYVLHNYYILTFVSFVILFLVHQKH